MYLGGGPLLCGVMNNRLGGYMAGLALVAIITAGIGIAVLWESPTIAALIFGVTGISVTGILIAYPVSVLVDAINRQGQSEGRTVQNMP